MGINFDFILCDHTMFHKIYLPIITSHKQSLRRLCFHKCLSVHRGVSATPQADPPWQTPPLPSACWDTHTPCPVHARIHTPCPVHARIHPLVETMGYGQQVGGTHPTGMHSCYSCHSTALAGVAVKGRDCWGCCKWKR